MISTAELTRDLATGSFYGNIANIGYTLPLPKSIQVVSHVSGKKAIFILTDTRFSYSSKRADYVSVENVKIGKIILFSL